MMTAGAPATTTWWPVSSPGLKFHWNSDYNMLARAVCLAIRSKPANPALAFVLTRPGAEMHVAVKQVWFCILSAACCVFCLRRPSLDLDVSGWWRG